MKKSDFKLVLCGDYSAGKTSLVWRLLRGQFNDHSQSTIGASYMTWRPYPTGRETSIHVGIWDTAGQERFGDLLPLYLREADIVLYCWECTVKFDRLRADKTFNKIKTLAKNAIVYFVLTKIDKHGSENHNSDLFTEYALQNNMSIFYTSSLTGENVEKMFQNIADDLVNRPQRDRLEGLMDLEMPAKNCCVLI